MQALTRSLDGKQQEARRHLAVAERQLFEHGCMDVADRLAVAQRHGPDSDNGRFEIRTVMQLIDARMDVDPEFVPGTSKEVSRS